MGGFEGRPPPGACGLHTSGPSPVAQGRTITCSQPPPASLVGRGPFPGQGVGAAQGASALFRGTSGLCDGRPERLVCLWGWLVRPGGGVRGGVGLQPGGWGRRPLRAAVAGLGGGRWLGAASRSVRWPPEEEDSHCPARVGACGLGRVGRKTSPRGLSQLRRPLR